jgi:parvulin-like peptidyl-prolyl isomerase
LTSRGISLAEYRRDLRFDIDWKNYVAGQLTDKRLQQYFEKHRRHYDGRRIRASHILLRPEQIDSPGQVVQAIRRARQFRQQIEAGQISFAEAAKKHSDGPSASRGGDLGFFPRRGVMVKTFSQAAFELDVGQISQPVVTKFGVHLIKVTAIRPGSLSWSRSRKLLQAAAAQELFLQLADRERETTPVRYMGTTAYVDPKTGQLVLPGKQRQ